MLPRLWLASEQLSLFAEISSQCHFEKERILDLLDAVPSHLPTQFSWWQQHIMASGKQPIQRSLVGQVAADIAIVGGGFKGMWTALILKERKPDLRIVVLDAFRCGDGASSRNGGNVHGYWGALPTLLPIFGVDKSLEAARLGTLAQRRLRDYATARGRDIWWTEEGYVRV